MDRGKVLSGIKDLVNTLNSPNICDENIMLKWIVKKDVIISGLNSLSSCDLLWVSEKYSEWFSKEIFPLLSVECRGMVKDMNFQIN
jgi:hypothetical protein